MDYRVSRVKNILPLRQMLVPNDFFIHDPSDKNKWGKLQSGKWKNIIVILQFCEKCTERYEWQISFISPFIAIVYTCWIQQNLKAIWWDAHQIGFKTWC